MSFKNLAWASEQSGISPNAKLLAIFIASHADFFGNVRFATQDAAVWCCFASDSVAARCTYELAKQCKLKIVRSDTDHDILTFEVKIPEAINGGSLI